MFYKKKKLGGVTSVEISMHVLGIDKLNEEKNVKTININLKK